MAKNKTWYTDTSLSLSNLIDFFTTHYDKFPNFGGDIETFFFNVRVAHSMRTITKHPKLKKFFNIDDLNQGLESYVKSKNLGDTNISYLHMYT